MSRSEVEPREPFETRSEPEAKRISRPRPAIERAFRWITKYRTQPSFVPIADRVLT